MNPTADAPGLAKQVASLRQLAKDVLSLLNSQKELLARAHLSLPPGVRSSLEQLEKSMEQIERSVAELEREREQLRALAEISRVINSSLDLTLVLNEVMDTIVELTGAERGFLMLKNADGRLDFRVARGMDRETLSEASFQVSRTIVERVERSGEPLVTTNAQADPRFRGSESVIGYNLRSILCVPLKVKDALTGVIYADNRIRTGLFTDHDRNLLAAFANQAAVALENARLFEEVRRQLSEISEIKNLLDSVFASIASGVITTDTQNLVTLCNRAAEAILGVTAQEAIGAPFDRVLPPIGPALARIVEAVKTAEKRVVGYEVNPVLESRGPINLSMNLTPLKDARNGTQGVAIVLEDLTEKKRLENKYQVFLRMVSPAVIESLPDDPDQLKLGGARREVTALFADIRGFTAFSEPLPPERLLEILNNYLAMAAEACLLQEGTLDKFMGDAVMAIFNAPLDQPDHTLRAARAALGMKGDIEAYHETVDARWRLSYGIGLNVGEAITGLIGTRLRLDYTAIGDSVNTAKRIQENAKPGQILLSEAAYARIKADVVVAELEPMKVKGKAQPVTVYELIRMK